MANDSENKLVFDDKSALFLWSALIILLNGIFRERTTEEIGKIDIVIILQLTVSIVSGIYGIVFFVKKKVGLSTTICALYLATAMVSSLLAGDQLIASLGYWILMFGGVSISLRLAYSSRSNKSILNIERTWIYVNLAVISYNIIASQTLFFTELYEEEVQRLGSGSVYASGLGFYAATVFASIIYHNSSRFNNFFNHILSLTLLILVILTKTRMPLFVCIIILIARYLINYNKVTNIQHIMAISITIAILCFGWILVANNVFGLSDNLSHNLRFEESNLKTISYRTYIWNNGLDILSMNPERYIYGYGLGSSKVELNCQKVDYGFYQFHMHNGYLENLFSIGIFGLILYIILVILSIKWIIFFKKYQRVFEIDTVIRAVSLTIVFFISSFIECPIGAKMHSPAMLFFFYIGLLDKAKI
jgi:O-antigen ligase